MNTETLRDTEWREDSPGTFLEIVLSDGTIAEVHLRFLPKLRIAVRNNLTNTDPLVEVEHVTGTPFTLRVASIVGWLISSPESRANMSAFRSARARERRENSDRPWET